jgi:hypothetical protein
VPGTRHLLYLIYPIPFPMSRIDFSVSGLRLSLFFSTGPVVPEVPTFFGSESPNLVHLTQSPSLGHVQRVPEDGAPEPRSEPTKLSKPHHVRAGPPVLTFSPGPARQSRESSQEVLGGWVRRSKSYGVAIPGRASHTHDVEAGVHVEDRPRDGRGHIAQQEHGGPGDVLLRDVPPKGAPGLIDLQDAGKVADP